MQKCTHRQGHVLDLINTREGYDFVRGVSASSMLSDYFLITSEISLERPFFRVMTVLYSNYKIIDKNLFL